MQPARLVHQRDGGTTPAAAINLAHQDELGQLTYMSTTAVLSWSERDFFPTQSHGGRPPMAIDP